MSLQKVKTPKRLKEFLIASAPSRYPLFDDIPPARREAPPLFPHKAWENSALDRLAVIIVIRYIDSRNSITPTLNLDKEASVTQTRLFTITGWLLNAAMIVCAFGGVILGFVLVTATVMGTGLWTPPEVVKQLEGVRAGYVMMIVGLACLAGMILLALAILVFRAIQQIVDSAISGDPFVVENADRLSRIGWLVVAIYGVQFAMGVAMGVLVPPQLKDNLKFGGFGLDFSPLGLLAILLVFVLAQIFRHGSEMRAELEGTV